MGMGKRLESLDALRGFDLFCLVVVGRIIHKLGAAIDTPWFDAIMPVFTHKEWEGFSPWDLVMPLFMFMAGVTIPYSLGKYRNGDGHRKKLFERLLRRVVLLWILGMAVQGNLLSLDPHRIYLYTNTLQAIAVGYIFSAIIFLHMQWKAQIGIAAALLLLFWAAMELISVGGYGGGDYTPRGNLAEGIDALLLGRFRDTANVVDGAVIISDSYTYTWILSSVNFVVTVLTGVLAGEILKGGWPQRKKILLLLGTGIGMVACGWTMHLVHPVIKHIWTSSMVLVSSGYCFLLLCLFYYWIDYKGHHGNLGFLKAYGMNSITAYVVSSLVSFSSVSTSLLHGFEQYTGNFYPVLIQLGNVGIIFLLLLTMYKNKIFIRI
ncbi:MAG: DUF5009 domain-containing protein [Bacteroidaceae bacterium]|nr:DUF5009 domain-containing protein [Bacteroidaceae bacterium]